MKTADKLVSLTALIILWGTVFGVAVSIVLGLDVAGGFDWRSFTQPTTLLFIFADAAIILFGSSLLACGVSLRAYPASAFRAVHWMAILCGFTASLLSY